MMGSERSQGACRQEGGFLTRLARDKRGNTLAIMVAMLVPLLGFTGAAIDMARVYVVKVRLQQACDAGALAGRKAMTDTSTATALDDGSVKQAQTFFANNFHSGWFGITGATFTPTKASVGTNTAVANAVNGQASVTVPMTILAMFGTKPAPLAVTCQAIYELADTDVMFVLDTTGSMSVVPSAGGEGGAGTFTRDDGIQAIFRNEQNGSKIEALRQAVVLFDKTMTENKQTDTIVRYGFAPYSTVVNIGKLLPASSITSTLDYNTRQQDGDYITTVASVTNIPSNTCVANGRYPASGYTSGFTYGSNSTKIPATGAGYVVFGPSVTWTNNVCRNVDSSNNGTAKVYRPMWKFGRFPLVVSDYAALKSVPTPGRINGMTSKWRGCVEITGDATASTFDPANLPSDLDPDSMPSWRPMWPEAVWRPQSTSDVRDEDISENYNYAALSAEENSDSVTCPMEAQALTPMTSTAVHNYVYANNFKAAGNTYHDYGMSWGLRMLSLKGPFASSAQPAAGRKQPSQNIVFMTDGAPVSDSDNYQMYGIEGTDGRIASGKNAQEITNHRTRLRALCDAAKLRGITVYMIAFGTSLTDDMKYCATSGQSFTATDSASLQTAFSSIAKRIAMLRVNQ